MNYSQQSILNTVAELPRNRSEWRGCDSECGRRDEITGDRQRRTITGIRVETQEALRIVSANRVDVESRVTGDLHYNVASVDTVAPVAVEDENDSCFQGMQGWRWRERTEEQAATRCPVDGGEIVRLLQTQETHTSCS